MGYISRREIDDILLIFTKIIRLWYFIQIVCLEDDLHEISKPVFWEKQEKYLKMSSAENFTQSAKR